MEQILILLVIFAVAVVLAYLFTLTSGPENSKALQEATSLREEAEKATVKMETELAELRSALDSESTKIKVNEELLRSAVEEEATIRAEIAKVKAEDREAMSREEVESTFDRHGFTFKDF